MKKLFGLRPYLSRITPGNEDISIVLKGSYVFILIDLFFRFGLLITGMILVFYASNHVSIHNVGIALGSLVLNFIFLFITIYYGKRRINGIQVYLKYRLLSYNYYLDNLPVKRPSQHSLFIYSDSSDKNVRFAFFYALGFTLFSCLLIYITSPINWITILSSLLSFLISFLLGWRYATIFIKREITKVCFSGKELSTIELERVRKYLDRELFIQDTSISFWNDKFIVGLEKEFKIYKEKLDTFLLESVFLGALTFTTFIQIIDDKSFLNKYLGRLFSFFMDSSQTEVWIKNKLDPTFGFSILLLGSVLSSIMYMIILIKRFPIIKSIENVKGHLKMAEFYNSKEEATESDDLKPDFTKQIQVEIAKCEEQKIILDSNFRIISFFRMMGLLSFFVVLLVATMMINFYFFIFSLILVLYVFIASRMIENNNWMKYFILDNRSRKKKKKNQKKFA
jgi:hypothetical protein